MKIRCFHGITVACLFVGSSVLFADEPADIIMVNSAIVGRTYEGTGALSAGASSRLLMDYPEEQRNQILDYLFKPRYGASLDHFKTEIGGDINSTCGTESSYRHTRDEAGDFYRGYEWWLMKEAKDRNPDIKLDILAWGAPFWLGDGRYYSDDLPAYMVGYLQGLKQVHHLDIDYIGVWNEMPYDTAYIKSLHRALQQAGLSTKIAAADEIRAYGICQDMLKDVELYDAVDVVGTHYPLGQGKELYNGKTVYEQYGNDYKIVWNEALYSGKPLWSLEDGPWAGDWNGAKGAIKVLIRNYIESKMVKTILWSLVSSYHDSIAIPASGLMKANTPWSGHYELQPALWAVAHLTQFASPGWIYLEGGANGYLENGGSYVSLVSPDGQDVSIVMETVEAKGAETIRLNLVGSYAESPLYIWRTDSANWFVKQPEVLYPQSGVVELLVEKGCIYTLTTTTGQRKGDGELVIPVDKPFGLPYEDDFEAYGSGRLPRYTSDIAGVFEVAEYQGNKVLKQVVPAKGIEWAASLNPEPYTLIGDRNMSDYEISVDVRLENRTDEARVMGRIPRIVQGQVVFPMGYWLSLSARGDYVLGSTDAMLKHGWSDFLQKWPESKAYFPDQTTNGRVVQPAELASWPENRIALFDGLAANIKENGLDGIVLVMYHNGSYQIYKQTIYASGKTNFPVRKWNRVALAFHGDRIMVAVNGRQIISVRDDKYDQGFATFGSGWHTCLFDNLTIQ